MAIYFIGESICPICAKVLKNNEQVFGFPPFVANAIDPLIFFNDRAFHYKCLLEHPLGPLSIQFSNRFIFKTRPQNRICDIGKNLIENPDDYIFIPLLTSNEEDALHQFNFMNIDKTNIKNWKKKDDFIRLAKIFQNEGKWRNSSRYDYLSELIEKLKTQQHD